MGKLEGNSLINHFSHQHPLRLQHLQSPIAGKTTCLACNGIVSGSVYTCVSCNFNLHKACSNLPRTLKHRSDQQHDLVLLSSPAYPEGVFKCNACGSHGNGFSYHCPNCQLDLHTTCASMPLSVDHAAHGHTLGLCFRPPYENKAFSCDICKQPGSNHWLYRCGLCEFDVHMKCARAVATSRSRAVPLPKSTTLPHHKDHQFSSLPRSLTPTPPPPPPNIQIYYASPTQYPNQYQGAQLEKLSTAASQVSLMKSTSIPHYETHYSPPPPRHQNPVPPPQRYQNPVPPPPPPPPISQPYYSQPPQHQHPQMNPQMNQYQTMGFPQHVQSTTKQNDIINNMAGHAVEGLVGSVVSAIIDGMVS